MKIYVSKMPKRASECLFAKKVHTGTYLAGMHSDKPVEIYQYFCSINNKLCNLYCSEKCNKLKVKKF